MYEFVVSIQLILILGRVLALGARVDCHLVAMFVSLVEEEQLRLVRMEGAAVTAIGAAHGRQREVS